ncbi:hypothetical protein HMPREF1486_03093 [Streptomyces sp. HPH0547]|nr:hypothetical protein HMPREF1486_03093 [Streptomyces sp. HPH0547]
MVPRSDLVIADHGEVFLGWITQRPDGSPICVATPRVETDPAERKAFRRLVSLEGRDCARCCNCLIGRDG